MTSATVPYPDLAPVGAGCGCAGFLLEALDIIEIPPEPPEQAGRNLYERLEISGMRSQLVRRTQDLKKNIAGAGRFLEILREMSSVVSEMKMFNVNESLDQNTKKMCILQVQSHTRTWMWSVAMRSVAEHSLWLRRQPLPAVEHGSLTAPPL